MPLVTCPDCGNQISSVAPACIHCGRPMTPGPAEIQSAPVVEPYAVPRGLVATTYPHPSIRKASGEPRYAGFGPRLLAGLVDMVVCLVPFSIPLLALSLSAEVTLTTRLFAVLISHGYLIVSTAIWGQTLGKRAARIQVRQDAGGPVNLGQAFLRDLLPFVCALLTWFASFIAFAGLDSDTLAQSPYAVRAAIHADRPAWVLAVGVISAVYALSDVVVFLVNGRSRALHDLLAGTVVVHTD